MIRWFMKPKGSTCHTMILMFLLQKKQRILIKLTFYSYLCYIKNLDYEKRRSARIKILLFFILLQIIGGL